MSTILPKGIVVNTEEISDDINPGEGEVVPVDQIARMWKGTRARHEAKPSLIFGCSIYGHSQKASRSDCRTARKLLVADMGKS